MNQKFTGTVIKLNKNNPNTAKVELFSIKIHPKYHKPQKIKKSKWVHYEEKQISLQLGDKVRIESCPPRSKTKRFLVIKKEEKL